MYGFMASANFYLIVQISHHEIKPYMPEFCFMMQIAMIAGFSQLIGQLVAVAQGHLGKNVGSCCFGSISNSA